MTIAKKTIIRDAGQITLRVTCLDKEGKRYEVTANRKQIFVGNYENAMKKFDEI